MNKIYTRIFDHPTGTCVVASEFAKKSRKKGTIAILLAAVVSMSAPVLAADNVTLGDGANIIDRSNGGVSGAVAIGKGAQSDAVPLGSVSSHTGIADMLNSSVAMGSQTVAFYGSLALGANAKATGYGSVALGNGSTSSDDLTASFGNKDTGLYRRVTNIAAGTQDHDAVNFGQLKQAGIVDAAGVVQTSATYTTADKSELRFGGQEGTRLTNVAAGTDDSDAVNVSQMKSSGLIDASGKSVAAVTYNSDASAVTLAGQAGTQIKNVADATGDMDAVNFRQLKSTGLVDAEGYTLTAVTYNADKSALKLDGPNGTQIKNVADGTDDSDAVNVRQLKQTGIMDPSGNVQDVAIYDAGSNRSALTFGGASGTLLRNVAAGRVGNGSMDAINGSQMWALQNRVDSLNTSVGSLTREVQSLGRGNGNGGAGTGDGSTTLGGGSTAGGTDSTALGGGSTASGDGSLAAGGGSTASGTDSTALGHGSKASGAGSTALGNKSTASGENSLASGNGANASGNGSIANGYGAQASGTNSQASGTNAHAKGDNSVATGTGAVAEGTNSMATGAGARASADNSVALGTNSVADRANTVSVGSAGNERQITNVAAGSQRTDAANWGQVQDSLTQANKYTDDRFDAVGRQMGAMRREANRGVASATALIGTMPYIPGKVALNAGVATYHGETALGVNMSRWNDAGNFNVNAGLSSAGQGDSVFRVGVGVVF